MRGGATRLLPRAKTGTLVGKGKGDTMNNGLYRLHHILFIAYTAFIVIFALIGLLQVLPGYHESPAIGFVGLGVLPLALVHYYAAKGAHAGRRWGRTLSRVIAAIMLIGFPVGTMIGIYVFSQTGRKWVDAPDAPSVGAS